MNNFSETSPEIEIIYDVKTAANTNPNVNSITNYVSSTNVPSEGLSVSKQERIVEYIDIDDNSDDDVECLGSFTSTKLSENSHSESEVKQEQGPNNEVQQQNAKSLVGSRCPNVETDMIKSLKCVQNTLPSKPIDTSTLVAPKEESSTEFGIINKTTYSSASCGINIVAETQCENAFTQIKRNTLESVCFNSQLADNAIVNEQKQSTSRAIPMEIENDKNSKDFHTNHNDSNTKFQLSETQLVPGIKHQVKRFIAIPARFLSKKANEVTNTTSGITVLKSGKTQHINTSQVALPSSHQNEIHNSVCQVTDEISSEKTATVPSEITDSSVSSPKILFIPNNPNISESPLPPSMLLLGNKLIKLKGMKQQESLSKGESSQSRNDQCCEKEKPTKEVVDRACQTYIYSWIFKDSKLISFNGGKELQVEPVRKLKLIKTQGKTDTESSASFIDRSCFDEGTAVANEPVENNQLSNATLPSASVQSSANIDETTSSIPKNHFTKYQSENTSRANVQSSVNADELNSSIPKNHSTKYQPENTFQEVLYTDLGLLSSSSEQMGTNQTQSVGIQSEDFHYNISEDNFNTNNTCDDELHIYDQALEPITEQHALPDCNTQNSTMDTNRIVDVFNKLLEDIRTCLFSDGLGNTPLHQAAIDNDMAKLKSQCIVLKTIGSNINHLNLAHETALMLAVKEAVESGSFDAVSYLIAEGADQRIADMNGNTPLHYAVSRGCDQLVRVLLTGSDADQVIEKFNYEGFTPLHIAAMEGFDDIIRQLVSTNTVVDIKDRKNGRTPFYLAVREKKWSSAELLTLFGADVNEPNFAEQTPVLVATADKSLLKTSQCVQRQVSVFPNLIEIKMPHAKEKLPQVSLTSQRVEMDQPSVTVNKKACNNDKKDTNQSETKKLDCKSEKIAGKRRSDGLPKGSIINYKNMIAKKTIGGNVVIVRNCQSSAICESDDFDDPDDPCSIPEKIACLSESQIQPKRAIWPGNGTKLPFVKIDGSSVNCKKAIFKPFSSTLEQDMNLKETRPRSEENGCTQKKYSINENQLISEKKGKSKYIHSIENNHGSLLDNTSGTQNSEYQRQNQKSCKSAIVVSSTGQNLMRPCHLPTIDKNNREQSCLKAQIFSNPVLSHKHNTTASLRHQRTVQQSKPKCKLSKLSQEVNQSSDECIISSFNNENSDEANHPISPEIFGCNTDVSKEVSCEKVNEMTEPCDFNTNVSKELPYQSDNDIPELKDDSENRKQIPFVSVIATTEPDDPNTNVSKKFPFNDSNIVKDSCSPVISKMSEQNSSNITIMKEFCVMQDWGADKYWLDSDEQFKDKRMLGDENPGIKCRCVSDDETSFIDSTESSVDLRCASDIILEPNFDNTNQSDKLNVPSKGKAKDGTVVVSFNELFENVVNKKNVDSDFSINMPLKPNKKLKEKQVKSKSDSDNTTSKNKKKNYRKSILNKLKNDGLSYLLSEDTPKVYRPSSSAQNTPIEIKKNKIQEICLKQLEDLDKQSSKNQVLNGSGSSAKSLPDGTVDIISKMKRKLAPLLGDSNKLDDLVVSTGTSNKVTLETPVIKKFKPTSTPSSQPEVRVMVNSETKPTALIANDVQPPSNRKTTRKRNSSSTQDTTIGNEEHTKRSTNSSKKKKGKD